VEGSELSKGNRHSSSLVRRGIEMMPRSQSKARQSRLDVVVVVVAMVVMWVATSACSRSADALKEWQRAKSGALDVELLTAQGVIRHGRDALVIEFRSSADGKLVDVGEVRATATMPMPGMPMFGSVEITRTNTPGQYRAVSEFEMAGTWRLNLQWQGTAGSGSVAFSASVQ
jgi:YtkA-like protein